jgi:BirA family biotin operon repressor/biotin-[acetyl-CoA-carboxylase] ligase
MEVATTLAEGGAPVGSVVVADYQTAGRGTHGRSWRAEPGSALLFTIVGRPELAPTDLEALPLRVATAVTSTLRSKLNLKCDIKPPNDILVRGLKICGVLCTSRVVGMDVKWVLAGIGMNTRMTSAQLPYDTATSLVLEGCEVPRHEVLLGWLLAELTFLR